MLNATHCKSVVCAEFFKPIFRFLDHSRHRRNCPALPDGLWLEAGVRRCLGLFQSGRDFLQNLAERHDTEILPMSREKDNMKLEILGVHSFDRADPTNRGVIADEIVGTCAGVSLRRVTWQDPETATIYVFLTNLPATIPPGIIVLLYKSRRDVEKPGSSVPTRTPPPGKNCQTRAFALDKGFGGLLNPPRLLSTSLQKEKALQKPFGN